MPATVHIRRRHLLLLRSPKADTDFLPRTRRFFTTRSCELRKVLYSVYTLFLSIVSDYLILFLPTYSLAIYHLWQ